MKNLLEQLRSICNEFKDENEIIIMKKYGNMAQRYTAIIIGKNDYLTDIARNKKLNDDKNQMIEKERERNFTILCEFTHKCVC